MKRPLTFDIVREMARELPGLEVGTTYGAPALKIRGKMFACVPSHRSAEPGSIVFRLDIPSRDAMILERPDVFYLTDHYVGYPCVLVRLSKANPDMLHDLVQAAYRFVLRTDRVTARRHRKRS